MLGTAMRFYRSKDGLSQREVSERVRTDHSAIVRWEKGQARPAAELVREYDKVVGAGGLIIELHAEAVALEKQQKGKLTSNSTSGDGDDEMERRATMRLLAALSAGAALPSSALEIIRPQVPEGFDHADDLAELESLAYEHACTIGSLPPREFIADLLPGLADVRHALTHRTDLDMADLHRVSSQLSALMAMALLETGDFTASRRWWRSARDSADASGDLNLRVWVRGRHALVESSKLGTPAMARIAAEAERLANGTASAGLMEVRVAQYSLRAREGDAAGRGPGLLAALDDLASRLSDEVTGEDKAIWGWSDRRHTKSCTGLRVLMGDLEVYDLLTGQVEEESDPRTHAMLKVSRGLCLVRAGDAGQGVAEAAAAYGALPDEHRTTAVKGWTRQVVTVLPAQAASLPAARELRALTTS
ncbi:helix-turn-helix domain-containing protein [Spongiactinospora rosea]|nr:helix-turn-helix transcriptional regulator [Spongiactinospora rosea]